MLLNLSTYFGEPIEMLIRMLVGIVFNYISKCKELSEIFLDCLWAKSTILD